jgi:predicted SAM-dependent methyltransferase
MVEHLDKREAAYFLAEAFRVLSPGGIIRLALPDLRRAIVSYMDHSDAERFVTEIFMGTHRPHTLLAWLQYVFTGPRHHLWMYDGPSAVQLLADAGFVSATVLPPGKTLISSPEGLNLAEGEDSVFVEAVRP